MTPSTVTITETGVAGAIVVTNDVVDPSPS
jgi:hypothetical protein